jgi:molybdopterin-guanine dinucleotide biosynthesis protein A
MVSIAIQAGGRSRRMGQDKALIPLGGKRLIEHVIDRLQDLSDDLFITTNQSQALEDLNLRLVPDEIPGQGAIFGLRTALKAARHEHVLVVACDMPFVQRNLVEHLLSLVDHADVIIPELDGNYEPMLAVYRSSTCLAALGRALEEQKQRMISFFPLVNVMPIKTEKLDQLDPDRLSFFNINTAEDVLRAERIVLQSRTPPRRSLDQQSSPDTIL